MAEHIPAGEGGPALDITEFFLGRTKAYGLFEDRFGRPRRSFNVVIDGAWDGEIFVLREDFLYDDGSRERRQWRIAPQGGGDFTATAPDCVGVSYGKAGPGRWRMRYAFMLRLKKRLVAVSFDDQVYKVDGRLAINRATASKWGVRLGQVLIVYERDAAAAPRSIGMADAA